MKTTDAIKYFGTQAKLGAAIGLKQHSVSGWGDLPPPLRQLQIEHITNGALKAHKGIMPRQRKKDSAKTQSFNVIV